MEIVEDPALRQSILDILTREYQLLEPRSGIHASDLIYCLTRSYWNKVDYLPPSEEDVLRFSIGLGLERVIIQFEAARPDGPFEVDGIVLTPDFTIATVHSELKTTRFSPGKTSDTWFKQIMAYCVAVADHFGIPTQYVYNLVVLHIIQPSLKAYRIFPTEEELNENWGWLLYRKEILKDHLDKQVPPPPFTYNEEWECGYCKYKLRCDLAASLNRMKQQELANRPVNVVDIGGFRESGGEHLGA